MMQKLRIAIAGCGIGGLSAALLLHRAGHRVVLFERFEQPESVGSGLVVQPVGQEVLRQLGLLPAVLALGNPISRMLGHDALSGRKVLDVAYDPDHGRAFGLAIHRASLFQVLYDAAVREGIRIEGGSGIRSVSNGPQRRLMLDSGREVGPFDLVIDAAGAGSPLSHVRSRALDYGALWGTVIWPQTGDEADGLLRQKYVKASRMLGILPIGRMPGETGQMATVFWSLRSDHYKAWLETPFEAWVAQAHGLWPEFGALVGQFTNHEQLTMAHYRHGTAMFPAATGLVHIGDAAHMTSPQLGQGANMALLDALALAHALARRDTLADALKTYIRTRRAHIWAYQLMSAAFTPMYQSDSRVLPFARDHLLMPFSQWRPVQRILGRVVRGEFMTPLKHLR